jgi:NAD(P)-dependent dehydrogenase (short-subunit alcohol dehydrogenase family)
VSVTEAADWSLDGRRCVVTGASSGIGRATAVGLAGDGARLALVCRDPLRAEETVAEIHDRTGSRAVEIFLADLASRASIRQVARELLTRCPRIDVLVNNAGVAESSRRETVDGVESMWGVNHLAYFQLTLLLLDRIRESAPARIVNVASEAHRFVSSLDPDDPCPSDERFRWWRAYGRSKLANILFTAELARRLAGSGVTVNAAHPGAVSTRLGHQNGWWAQVVTTPLRPFFRSPEQGAATSLHLARAPELAGVTGRYFADEREKRPSGLARDEALASRLWSASERQLGAEALAN